MAGRLDELQDLRRRSVQWYRTAACRRGCRQLRSLRRSCLVVFSLRQRGELARLGDVLEDLPLLGRECDVVDDQALDTLRADEMFAASVGDCSGTSSSGSPTRASSVTSMELSLLQSLTGPSETVFHIQIQHTESASIPHRSV